MSKALEMSRAITKDAPKSLSPLERKTSHELGRIEDHQSISLYGSHIDDLREENEIQDV